MQRSVAAAELSNHGAACTRTCHEQPCLPAYNKQSVHLINHLSVHKCVNLRHLNMCCKNRNMHKIFDMELSQNEIKTIYKIKPTLHTLNVS